MAKNSNLHAAKTAKNDEFYTQLTDIEKECKHYRDFFRGKVVYCNCDDARESNFFKYFTLYFETLGLKKLITTGFKADGHGVILTYDGDKNGNHIVDDEEIVVTEMQGNGDFRSEECIAILKEADVVVTNPPFSLFREYVAQLMEYNKKFLIIGGMNAITYKEIFPLIKENKLWLGYNQSGHGNTMYFEVPSDYKNEHNLIVDGKVVAQVTAKWFTNIDHNKRHEPLDLYKKYSAEEYPKYDNYDAIECGKTADIPMDYDGLIGVPISFLDKYCPEQFEIVDAREVALNDKQRNKNTYLIKDADSAINGKPTYARIAIRAKH